MSKKNEMSTNSIPSKKELRKKLAATLQDTFNELKEQLGEKKFSIRVKKAARLLAAGIKSKAPVAAKKPKGKKNATVMLNNNEPAISAIV